MSNTDRLKTRRFRGRLCTSKGLVCARQKLFVCARDFSVISSSHSTSPKFPHTTHTTHLTQLISTHLFQLISHNSTYSIHLPRKSLNSFHSSHLTQVISLHSHSTPGAEELAESVHDIFHVTVLHSHTHMGADRKCKSKNYERACVSQHLRL